MFRTKISVEFRDLKGKIVPTEVRAGVFTGIGKGLEALGKLSWSVMSVDASFTENGDGFCMVVYFRDALGREGKYGTNYRLIGRRLKIPSVEELVYVFASSDGVNQSIRKFLEKALVDIPSILEEVQEQISPNE